MKLYRLETNNGRVKENLFRIRKHDRFSDAVAAYYKPYFFSFQESYKNMVREWVCEHFTEKEKNLLQLYYRNVLNRDLFVEKIEIDLTPHEIMCFQAIPCGGGDQSI